MKSQIQRRKDSDTRLAEWQTLTPMEQMRDLDRRLGVGVGAKRQRAKLSLRIARMESPTPVKK